MPEPPVGYDAPAAPEGESGASAPVEVSRARTIFDTHEAIDRDVPWDDAPNARIRDALAIAIPELPDAQRDVVVEMVRAGDRISLDAITDAVGDGALGRRVAKLAKSVVGKEVEFSSFFDRVRYAFTTTDVRATGLAAARALRWLAASTGRDDLRVTYPASGADATGFLEHIGAAPLARVDCVTLAGPQGADEKARTQGVDARRIHASIDDALHRGDIPEHQTDCLLLDASGFGVVMGEREGKLQPDLELLDRLLAPGGIIVATSGYLGAGGTAAVRRALASLPITDYRLVGMHGDGVFIVERKVWVDEVPIQKRSEAA